MRTQAKDTSTPSEGLELTLDLAEAGIQVMRENFRRRFPNASGDEIEARVDAWLQIRPGAQAGDGPQPRREQAA